MNLKLDLHCDLDLKLKPIQNLILLIYRELVMSFKFPKLIKIHKIVNLQYYELDCFFFFFPFLSFYINGGKSINNI
ncbi:hypothetical protein TRFO_17440 [Tritrichomonas foetus]|uniref:Uncharacterized protein n=1 Tax=Tritrichomonas foetus TaxID=1144522 RepID=A0A1J4KP65_9EUKA|nr:hypothetical protein TRFO_17440 [Tritrichomonas foetus]|eukprot:OHT12712.1 hypothetical protein TRFO_17440 [Tritrichomonas foetus]